MRKDFAEQYGDLVQWHWWFRGRRDIIGSVLERELTATGPLRILSLGCGPAAELRWLLPFAQPDGEVVGLDSDPRHGQSLPLGVKFVTGSLEAPPFASHSFDAVLAMDVLEHLDNDTAGLIAAAELVRQGGILLITVPAFPFLWGGQDIVSHHRRRYTRKTLRSLLERAGLRRYRISYFNTFLFPLAATVRTARRFLGIANRARSDFEGTRPGLLNTTLAGVFGAERHLLKRSSLPFGLSLMATCHL